MSVIPVSGLIDIFQTMYAEHWDYVWGAAEKGCVDCSGAFVYAYRQYGKSIYHGSNTIGRRYIIELLPISKAEPGMAAFKCKDWTETESGNKWYGQEPGNLSHIGLVDEDTKYVLNAKGTAYGFCRDKLTAKNGWDYVARLTDVDYGGGGGGGTSVTVTISGGNTSSPINMRSKASLKSPVIILVPQGATAEKIGEDGEWSQINYLNYTGYIMTKFVHEGSEPQPSGDTIAVPKAELQTIYDTIGGWLGLRG